MNTIPFLFRLHNTNTRYSANVTASNSQSFVIFYVQTGRGKENSATTTLTKMVLEIVQVAWPAFTAFLIEVWRWYLRHPLYNVFSKLISIHLKFRPAWKVWSKATMVGALPLLKGHTSNSNCYYQQPHKTSLRQMAFSSTLKCWANSVILIKRLNNWAPQKFKQQTPSATRHCTSPEAKQLLTVPTLLCHYVQKL